MTGSVNDKYIKSSYLIENIKEPELLTFQKVDNFRNKPSD